MEISEIPYVFLILSEKYQVLKSTKEHASQYLH